MSGPNLPKTQQGMDFQLKNDDFGTNFGAHFLLALLVFFWSTLFWDDLKHEKGRILSDVGWRKTQEGQVFERCRVA